MTHNVGYSRSGRRERLERAVAYFNVRLADAESEEFAAVLGRIASARGGACLADKVALSADLLYCTLSPRGNSQQRAATALLKAMGLRRALVPISGY